MGLMGGNRILQILLIDAGVHVTQAPSLEHVESGCHFHAHVNHHGLHGILQLEKRFISMPQAACS